MGIKESFWYRIEEINDLRLDDGLPPYAVILKTRTYEADPAADLDEQTWVFVECPYCDLQHILIGASPEEIVRAPCWPEHRFKIFRVLDGMD